MNKHHISMFNTYVADLYLSYNKINNEKLLSEYGDI